MLSVNVTAADLRAPGCPVEAALRRCKGWERAVVGNLLAFRSLDERPVHLPPAAVRLVAGESKRPTRFELDEPRSER